VRRVALAIVLAACCAAPAAAGPLACTVSATGIAFTLNYDVFNATQYTITATVIVNCNKNNVPFTLSLDAGANSASLPNRFMKRSGGTDLLQYNMYTNVGHSTVLGDGTAGTITIAGNAPNSGVNANTSIYGLLIGGQDQRAGSYSDTVNVTVTY